MPRSRAQSAFGPNWTRRQLACKLVWLVCERDCVVSFNRQAILLNAVMLTALIAVAASALRRFLPAWQPGYLIVACALIALEAGIVHRAVWTERMWSAEMARYLVPELMVMTVCMRVAATLSLGTATLAADARRWLYDPLSIFEPLFVTYLLVGLVAGMFAHTSMRDITELEPQPFEGPGKNDDDSKRSAALAAADRALALGRINTRFVGGGALLLCALGLEAVNIERLSAPGLPISRLSAIGAIVYLVSGCLLYSQARLAMLQSRWRLEGVEVATGVARRWTRSSLLLIGGVAGFALLLPRAYGMGLIDTLRGMLGLLGYTLALLGYLVVWLFSLLALIPALLLSLFSRDQPPVGNPIPPFVPPDAPATVAREPQLLPALVFWVCMFFLAGYALWIVVQRHPGLFEAFTSRGPLAWVLRWFGKTWGDARSWAGQAAQQLRVALSRPPAQPRRRFPALRLGRLAPRDLVLYFYRSTIRRAAGQGLRRHISQTPYEYRATLAQHLPDIEQELSELTESFVAAQYSPRPVSADDARRVRRPWERVRGRLRGLRDEQQTTNDEGE